MNQLKETNPASEVVAFRNVHIGFDRGEVLRGINFSVRNGETKVLLGESGSGKTVLLKLAAGLLKPDSGEVGVMRHKLETMDERELLKFRVRIGFVFQEGALFDSHSVFDNVAFRMSQEGVPMDEMEARVREALRFVDLESAIEKYPPELSGGMQRRVSIARALVNNPELVLYDSPTAGLDPVTSQTIIALILRLRDLQGVTSLLATHRLQDFFGISDFRFDKEQNRVVSNKGDEHKPLTTALMIRDGVNEFEGDAEAVLQSNDSYLERFLASAQ